MARILLADDDAALRDFARRALEADGHKVVEVPDGSEALDRLTAEPGAFDLIVSDVNMPTVDGVTLANKAVAANPKLRVLLISGYASELVRSQNVAAARLGHLAKPFTLEQIREAVRKVLS